MHKDSELNVNLDKLVELPRKIQQNKLINPSNIWPPFPTVPFWYIIATDKYAIPFSPNMHAINLEKFNEDTHQIDHDLEISSCITETVLFS